MMLAAEKTARTRKKAARPDAGADSRGVGGEATRRALAGLDESEWTVWHDVRWPGRKKASLDNVVIGPTGVYVVVTQNWSGVVSFHDGVLRQDGRPREAAVTEAAEAAHVVQGLIPGVPVHAVICLVQGDPAEGQVGDVLIRSPKNVCEMLITRPPVLAAMDLWRVQSTLEQKLRTGESAQAPRKSAVASADRPKSGSRVVRLVAALVIVAALAGGVQTGAFTHVGSAVSDFVAGLSGEDESPEPPKDGPKKKKQAGQEGCGGSLGGHQPVGHHALQRVGPVGDDAVDAE